MPPCLAAVCAAGHAGWLRCDQRPDSRDLLTSLPQQGPPARHHRRPLLCASGERGHRGLHLRQPSHPRPAHPQRSHHTLHELWCAAAWWLRGRSARRSVWLWRVPSWRRLASAGAWTLCCSHPATIGHRARYPGVDAAFACLPGWRAASWRPALLVASLAATPTPACPVCPPCCRCPCPVAQHRLQRGRSRRRHAQRCDPRKPQHPAPWHVSACPWCHTWPSLGPHARPSHHGQDSQRSSGACAQLGMLPTPCTAVTPRRYMLVIISDQGVPSASKIISIP